MLVHIVCGIPSTTLFFRNYYVGLPQELVKAAMLDWLAVAEPARVRVVPAEGPPDQVAAAALEAITDLLPAPAPGSARGAT